MDKKIMIASAIHKENEILKEFLESLEELDTKGLEVKYCFIDDNDDKESVTMVKTFLNRNNGILLNIEKDINKNENYICDDITHRWNNELIKKIINFKNTIIEYFLKTQYEYLFFIDADLVLHPMTLQTLIRANKDIVSNIFWTKWIPNSEELPQVWQKDFYTMYNAHMMRKITEEQIRQETVEFLNMLKKPGLYKVGGLGACTLIKRKPLEDGVNFNEIYNISFWGEDRYFSIRAVSYGYDLFVDTHYPAYHIYRMSELQGITAFKEAYKKDVVEEIKIQPSPIIINSQKSTLTLSMIVKNEEGRYLERALKSHKDYIDKAVIIDDGSNDRTKEIVKDILGSKNLILIENKESNFSNEINLRKQQWDETIKNGADWILNLDADEIFEKSFNEAVRNMIEVDETIYGYAFRLYDFWSEGLYRNDDLWYAHRTYRPFLIRYNEKTNYKWRETPQHCGRFPYNIGDLKIIISRYRLMHYGWLKEEDRIKKYERYLKYDPEGMYGSLAQYKSILDKDPNLTLWIE